MSTEAECETFTHEMAHRDYLKVQEAFSTLEASTTHYMTEWWGGAYKDIYGLMEDIRTDLAAAGKGLSEWEVACPTIREKLDNVRASYEKARARLEEDGL